QRKMLLHALYLFVFNSLGYGNKDDVSQPQIMLEVLEEQQVMFLCSYATTRAAPELFWYIQRRNDIPRHLLTRSAGYNPNADDLRFDAKLIEKERTVHLTISSAKLSDSAMYYCALRPTAVERKLKCIHKNISVQGSEYKN
uniref:Ig-like domain-containing protein n=1 Tax=Erpetoichthys calabaricus TaxID=27687 RepID=A0A8C4RZ18_ERPCA